MTPPGLPACSLIAHGEHGRLCSCHRSSASSAAPNGSDASEPPARPARSLRSSGRTRRLLPRPRDSRKPAILHPQPGSSIITSAMLAAAAWRWILTTDRHSSLCSRTASGVSIGVSCRGPAETVPQGLIEVAAGMIERLLWFLFLRVGAGSSRTLRARSGWQAQVAGEGDGAGHRARLGRCGTPHPSAPDRLLTGRPAADGVSSFGPRRSAAGSSHHFPGAWIGDSCAAATSGRIRRGHAVLRLLGHSSAVFCAGDRARFSGSSKPGVRLPMDVAG